MNKGSTVERLCRDLITKSRDINGLLYFTLLYFNYPLTSRPLKGHNSLPFSDWIITGHHKNLDTIGKHRITRNRE